MKITRGAIYAHRSAVHALPKRWRERLERVQLQYAQTLKDFPWTVVKFSTISNQVSFLWYPDFFKRSHPWLKESIVVTCGKYGVRERAYAPETAPVLHRKELMLLPDHAAYARGAALTAQEEKAELLNKPPGNFNAWQDLLVRKGYRIHDHVLVKVSS